MTIKVIEASEVNTKGWTAKEVWENGCLGDAFVDGDGYVHVVCAKGLDRAVVTFDPYHGEPVAFDEHSFFETCEEDTFRPVNVELKWTYK